MRRAAGFTLIEMLLSVAIIGLLVGMSLPFYQPFLTRNDLETTTQSLATALRRAQTYARGVNGDNSWGVAVQSGTITVFEGATYASRDIASDETTTIPANISASGLSEVVFAKFTALPATTGTITLTATTNDTRTITLNAKGMVNY